MFLFYFQIDLTFVQALVGIRDVDKSGVTKDMFSEVSGYANYRNAALYVLLFTV